MKKTFLLCLLLSIAVLGYGQEVIFELEIGTEGRGLDAFVINNAQAFEDVVTDPPPGFPEQGLILGPDTSGIWLDNFRGTDYQIDAVWLDVGQWIDETSDGDADGILSIRGQNIASDIRAANNAGYNVEREKDATGYGQGGLKIVSFFGDGSDSTELDQRRVNDGTVPTWQGMSLRAHGSQISVVAWDPPADGNVPPALEIDFNTPHTVVFWDEVFSEGLAGISWASGSCEVVFFRVTDLSDVPAPTPPPAPDDIIIEAETGEPVDFSGGPSLYIGTGTDTKTDGSPEVMVFPNDTDPANDGVENFDFIGGVLPEDLVGGTDWVIYRYTATAEEAGLYEVYYRGRNVNSDSANVVLRSNPEDPMFDPYTGADGVTFHDMETHLMRRTTEPAGLIQIHEGENVLTVSSWESGFLLDQILLEKTTADVAFIGSSWPPAASDPDVIYRLESQFGTKVIAMPSPVIANSDPPRRAIFAPQALEQDPIKLLVISATISSGNVANHYLNADVPILFMEQAIFDDMQMGSSGTNLAGLTEFDITDTTHSITEGFSGTVTMQDSVYPTFPSNLAYVTSPGENIDVLATVPGDESQVTLAAVDAGAELLDGSTAVNRRAYFGFADWNFGDDMIADDAWTLFDQTVEWLLGGDTPVQDWSIY